MTATLMELRNGVDPVYWEKQLHPVPDAKAVDRTAFILERCKGKVVLDIGASGRLHESIVRVAAQCYGIDREDSPGVFGIDLDDFHAELPQLPDVEIVICGEVIEHLSNPGWLLKRLKEAYRCPVIITVPNAHADSGRHWLERGIDCVNRDHVAWYSHRTLQTLLEREGYEIKELRWYNGRPKFSEGLIVVTE